MIVLFNNPQLYVIEYPAHDALEILDKRNGRLGLVRGPAAERIRAEFRSFLRQPHDEEEFDEFLDTHGAFLEHPAILH